MSSTNRTTWVADYSDDIPFVDELDTQEEAGPRSEFTEDLLSQAQYFQFALRDATAQLREVRIEMLAARKDLRAAQNRLAAYERSILAEAGGFTSLGKNADERKEVLARIHDGDEQHGRFSRAVDDATDRVALLTSEMDQISDEFSSARNGSRLLQGLLVYLSGE